MAFQVKRQFTGFSMLVKKRCFVCHKPNAKKCSGCQCACFCNKECMVKGWKAHKKLCKLINVKELTLDKECLQINLTEEKTTSKKTKVTTDKTKETDQ